MNGIILVLKTILFFSICSSPIVKESNPPPAESLPKPSFARSLERLQPAVIRCPESEFSIPKLPLSIRLEPVAPFPMRAFGEDLDVFVPLVSSPSDFVVI